MMQGMPLQMPLPGGVQQPGVHPWQQ